MNRQTTDLNENCSTWGMCHKTFYSCNLWIYQVCEMLPNAWHFSKKYTPKTLIGGSGHKKRETDKVVFKTCCQTNRLVIGFEP